MKKLWKKIKKAAKKVANAVVTVIVQVTNIIKEVFLFRPFGFVEFLLALLGVRLPQKLRLHIVILRDEAGVEQATEADLQASIDEARHIFQQEMKVRIIPAYGSFIRTLDAPAPSYVLDVGCDFNAWVEDFGDAGAWFRERIAYTASGILTGYASPVTVFIVRSVAGDYQACSLGPLTDYITLEGKAIKDKAKKDNVPAHILAHELVHACGHIGHIKDHGNLMFRDAKVSGGTLYPWQEALARSSRHVTLL